MKTKNQKDIFKITPGIELNASTAAKAAPQLQKALEKAQGTNAVELDLTENTSFDSGSLKLLLALAQECQSQGRPLQIQATAEAKRFLNLFNLQRRMSIITQEVSE